MGMTIPNIVEYTTDPQLLNVSLSPAQEVIQRAIYALSATAAQRELFHDLTGRTDWPTERPSEVTLIGGARGGKDSRLVAPIACYEACFGGHEPYLARGERGVIPLVYQDARASRVGFDYIKTYLTTAPLLASLVEDVLATEIRLTNRISIMGFPCTVPSLRSWSIPHGTMNELGFFPIQGQANSDDEIQTSIRRGMVGFPRTLLLKVSTPYLRAGVLHDDFTKFWGVADPDRLVVRTPSWVLNPTLAERLVRERRLDPIRFEREFGATFTDDLSACFDYAALMACRGETGMREHPPIVGIRYKAHTDAAAGEKKGNDAFTVSIGHLDARGRAVQDLSRAWKPPFNPSGVIAEIVSLLRLYNLNVIQGDHYAPGFVAERFREHGIRYEPCALDTSELFLELLNLVNSQTCVLLDDAELLNELRTLERRRGAAGKDRIGHPSGLHDDRATSCAGVLWQAAQLRRPAQDFVGVIRVGDCGRRREMDYTERVGHRVLTDQREARNRAGDRLEAERRRLMAPPAQDPFAALKQHAAEHGTAATIAMLRDLNGPDAPVPDFLAEAAGKRACAREGFDNSGLVDG